MTDEELARLRDQLAESEELRRQQMLAHHLVMDSQQREIVALREENARLSEKLADYEADFLAGTMLDHLPSGG